MFATNHQEITRIVAAGYRLKPVKPGPNKLYNRLKWGHSKQ